MLEQMYLITAPKISVLGPNCWETTTEFSRHKNRSQLVVRLKVHPLFSPRVSHFAQGSNDLALPPH